MIMSRYSLMFYLILGVALCKVSCQNENKSLPGIEISDPDFDKTLKSYLDFSVALISVDSLYKNQADYVILDAREKEEYLTSHIPNARHLGYKDVNWELINDINKKEKLLVYCSIGYRSEKLGEKLKRKGFEVYNLYGSIFEWANKGYPLQDAQGKNTYRIHGYNKKWSKWVLNDKMHVTY